MNFVTLLRHMKKGGPGSGFKNGISQCVPLGGDWERQTDQAICETSTARTVTVDTETRKLVTRETTIKATDKTTVIGTATFMAGVIQ